MSKVWSIIKFKIKEGCVDEFLEMERKLLSPRNHFLSSRIIRIDQREYANIVEYESMDKTIDHQDEGLDWLDSVEHLLEWYEDSRTDAFSGIEIDEF